MAQSIDKITQHLDSENPDDASSACVALCILMSQPNYQSNSIELAILAPKLAKLLDTTNEQLLQNALAATSACLETNDDFVTAFIPLQATPKLVNIANTSEDADMRMNALTSLGSLAEASPAGMEAVLSAGTIQVALELCKRGIPPLIMAGADTLCKLMANSNEAKIKARELGAVPILGSLVGECISIRVYALMGLGMLVEGHEDALLQLASTHGAALNLMNAARSDEDGDCQQIARSLVTGLATGSQEVRTAMANSMRADMDAAKEANKK